MCKCVPIKISVAIRVRLVKQNIIGGEHVDVVYGSHVCIYIPYVFGGLSYHNFMLAHVHVFVVDYNYTPNLHSVHLDNLR